MVESGGRDSGVRLPELVAAFSLATDLGLGQPLEHVLRSWRIASRLGEHLGIDPEERGALYYVATLAWVGCVADTPLVAAWFGDDIAFRKDYYDVDFAGLPLLGHLLRHVGAGSPALYRVRLGTKLVVTGGKGIQQGLMSHCVTTAQLAGRFGLDDDRVGRPLQQVFARWDGTGMPRGVGGEQIALSMRLFHLADMVEVHHRTQGLHAAVEVARARSGKQFDPAVVDAFCSVAHEVLGDPMASYDWKALIEDEPSLQRRLTEDELEAAIEAMADFTDLRSAFRSGHSRSVAGLAERAALELGLPTSDVVAVRRAGLAHDIGMHAVPANILDKAEQLSPSESERLRMYPYYTQRMLARPETLARVGALASLACERSDGSGCHRGLSGAAIPLAGRVVAAACAFQAMTEPRAHRPAMTPNQAKSQLYAEARAGRFDPGAVDAVLAGAGLSRGKRRTGPAGLSPREIEVLTLIARGASTRQVAQRLFITPKTAETHIERIYAKTGATTRSTATLFAMQHGLLETLEPFEV